MAEGLCQRFCFDTYDREIERYGGPAGMAAAEAIFTSDSPAVVDLLALMRATPDLDRLTATIVSIDDLLAAAGLSEMQRLAWYADRVKSRHSGGDEFRQRKSVLRPVLGRANGIISLPGGEAFARILAQRRRSLGPAAARLVELEARGELTKSRDAILHSIVHLHCNRVAGNDWGSEERALGVLLRTCRSLKEAPLLPKNQ
jgi:thiopeptide-type bacteriocin biosynthesis protein